MVSLLLLSAVDLVFQPRLGQIKDDKIGICCFSTKHITIRKKSKDRLVRNLGYGSECGDMTIWGLLFQWASTIKIHINMLV